MKETVEVPTKTGIRKVDVLERVSKNIVIIEALCPPKGYSVTHAPTGCSFCSFVGSKRLARKIAVTLGKYSAWDWLTKEEVLEAAKEFPLTFLRWLKQLQDSPIDAMDSVPSVESVKKVSTARAN